MPATIWIAPAPSFSRKARARLALLAARQIAERNAGRLAKRRQRLEMLPRQYVGRCHDRGLRPGLDRCRHRKCGDHGLARADIALQQAQHAARCGHIRFDLGQRLLLRAGELIGQGGAHLLGEVPAAHQRAPGKLPVAAPDERDCKLGGEHLVKTEPFARLGPKRDIAGRLRPMQKMQRARK